MKMSMAIWRFASLLQRSEAVAHTCSCSICKWRTSKDENFLFAGIIEIQGKRCVLQTECIGQKFGDEPVFVALLVIPWIAFKVYQVAAEARYLHKHLLLGRHSQAQIPPLLGRLGEIITKGEAEQGIIETRTFHIRAHVVRNGRRSFIN